MDKNLINEFLQSFFALFKMFVKKWSINGNEVLGVAGFEDEVEEQTFSWQIPSDLILLNKIKLLCYFIVQNNLIQGDRIIIDEEQLKEILKKNNWDKNDSEMIINKLFSIEIKMVDEGVETDSFFIHF